MEKYTVKGGKPLKGCIEISGAKNAAVAIIPAVILAEGPCVLENLPNISDVSVMINILHEMGAQIENIDKHTIKIDATKITTSIVPYELSKKMRASYYFLGSLLGRFNKASVSMPGGCDFGTRPINQHLKGFQTLGADYTLECGMIDVKCEKLVGGQIFFDVVTVGATMNVMLAAVKAQGLTIIENAAKEPHIVDLANFLNSMGADIMGAGTDTIKIRGVEHLHGTTYSIIPDQIEAGTYMVAAVATKGDLLIKNVIPKHLESIISNLEKIGANVVEYDDSVRVYYDRPLTKCNIKTMPHPGFPTDMQPQITTLLTLAEGTSMVTEGVWDNRFKYVAELTRMNADISVDGRVAVIEGKGKLTPAPVKASDLRAGAAMVIAALCADGVTEIEDIHHIERGYEDIVEKLTAVGADITKTIIPDGDMKQAL